MAIPARHIESANLRQADPLALALQRDIQARNALQQHHERLQQALANGADSCDMELPTDDAREAIFRVVYRLSEETVDVVGAFLIEIDGRPATAQEQVRYQDALEGALRGLGDLWVRVTSHIWHSR